MSKTSTETLAPLSLNSTHMLKPSQHPQTTQNGHAKPSSSSPSATSTLRSLYSRAAKGFVHRDMALTHALLTDAFALLPPPSSTDDMHVLDDMRRKWDILRITLETTLYGMTTNHIPEPLKHIRLRSKQATIEAIYTRSLRLFSPSTSQPDPVFLPAQLVITIIYSALKLDCLDSARVVVEGWLARRRPSDADFGEFEDAGYQKVIELYCLQILPKLSLWDYASEFLSYESEMPPDKRKALQQSFDSLRQASLRPPQSPSPPSTPPPSTFRRSSSPTPSTSSSLSTTSTHTAVPCTPRAGNSSSILPLSKGQRSPSSGSSSSTATATPQIPIAPSAVRSPRPLLASRHPRTPSARSSSASLSQASSRPHFRSLLNHPETTAIQRTPSVYALIKTSLQNYLSSSRFTTLLFLFVVLPFLSLFIRLRRSRVRANGNFASGGQLGGAVATADLVRRRLHAAENAGMIGRIWREAARALVDTVKMAGSGLV